MTRSTSKPTSWQNTRSEFSKLQSPTSALSKSKSILSPFPWNPTGLPGNKPSLSFQSNLEFVAEVVRLLRIANDDAWHRPKDSVEIKAGSIAAPEESHRLALWKFRFSSTKPPYRDCRRSVDLPEANPADLRTRRRLAISGKPNYPQDKPAGLQGRQTIP